MGLEGVGGGTEGVIAIGGSGIHYFF